MDVYCTSRNSGPSWQFDPVTIVYLGTSLEEAREAVGDFSKYAKTNTNSNPPVEELYCSLPRNIRRELVQYYAADGWWYTIVKFQLLPPPLTKEDVQSMMNIPDGV